VTCNCTMFVGPIVGKFLDDSHHIYRSTYLASFGLTVLALLAGFLLHRKFMARGGPNHYVARE
jgi:hypothetical protein